MSTVVHRCRYADLVLATVASNPHVRWRTRPKGGDGSTVRADSLLRLGDPTREEVNSVCRRFATDLLAPQRSFV